MGQPRPAWGRTQNWQQTSMERNRKQKPKYKQMLTLPPCVKMMTPHRNQPGLLTRHRKPPPLPQCWFVLWLLHCCIWGALVLWQTEGLSHRRKCGGGVLTDRNAKLVSVPIWSQLSSGPDHLFIFLMGSHTQVDLGFWGFRLCVTMTGLHCGNYTITHSTTETHTIL